MRDDRKEERGQTSWQAAGLTLTHTCSHGHTCLKQKAILQKPKALKIKKVLPRYIPSRNIKMRD